MARHTYGRFVDAVAKAAKADFPEALAFIEEWKTSGTADWKAYTGLELTKELVLAFAQDMRTFFRERLNGICTDALYASVTTQAHAFLDKVHALAARRGIQVAPHEIDGPITYTEILAVICGTKAASANT